MVWLLVLAVIFAAEYTVMLVLPWLPGQPSWLVESVVDCVLLTIVVAPVLWWTVVRPLQQAIRIRTRFLTELFSSIEAEQRRVAHELHDSVGQSLTLLLSGLRTLGEDPKQPDLPQRLQQFQELGQLALRDIRQITLGLRPSLLDDFGLAPAIELLAERVQETIQLELTVDVAAIAGKRFSEELETAVFRIVQEALNNVVKHAAAQRASVRVQFDGNQIVVEVRDNGRGFDQTRLADMPPGLGHLGLLGMRERATLLGGSLACDSHPGHGTRVTATIPAGVTNR
jgi:two-component system sensor histidine kinase UhpB